MKSRPFIVGCVLVLGTLTSPNIAQSADCNGNGIDDACDLDCGSPHGPCDVPGCGTSTDCNANGIPDDCDMSPATQEDKLTAADAAAGDDFGLSVSISGDTAVIGSWLDDDAGPDSGSAYVFVRTAGVWTQQAKLTAADAAAGDRFGRSVSIIGDTAVISAYFDDDAGSSSGSAYIFVRTGTIWTQQAKLTAVDAAAGDPSGDDNGNGIVEMDLVFAGSFFSGDEFNIGHFQMKGSPGKGDIRFVNDLTGSAYPPPPPPEFSDCCGGPAGCLLVHNTGNPIIFTFKDLSLLFGEIKEGTMGDICVDLETGRATATIEIEFRGGRGKYEGATGDAVITAEIEPVSLDGALRGETGTIVGQIILPGNGEGNATGTLDGRPQDRPQLTDDPPGESAGQRPR